MSNPLDNVTDAVAALEDALPALLEACTDPQALDMAELFDTIQQARVKLAAIERDTELACAKALPGNRVDATGMYVERYRSPDRKAWKHEDWQRDVRTKALRAAGLAGAQAVVTADGETLPASVLHEVLRNVQAAHSAAGPKTGAIRGLGLDPDDYCERSQGAWHVKVHHVVDETAPAEAESGGQTDAA